VKIGKQRIYDLPSNDVRILNIYAQQLRESQAASDNLFPLVNLLIGEPDFPTPEHIRHAAIEAIQHQSIGYGPAAGWPWLKDLIAAKIQQVNGYTVDTEHIAITMGGTGAVQAAFMAILREGDEVLVPDPAWPQYQLQLVCCAARAIYYPLKPTNHWYPDLVQLEQLVTPRTRMLIINSPANPSGVVFPPQLIANLLDFALRHDLYLLSDECYDEIIFEGEHVSPATFLSTKEFEDGRVICVYTFSKTYAMTGWRIGYMVASKELMKTMTHVLDSSYTNISKIVQCAAAAALTGPRTCVHEMRLSYQQRRDCAIALLKSLGHYSYTPQGAFYVLVDISNPLMPLQQAQVFAHALLQKYYVAVAPGTSFGSTALQWVRVSLTSPEQDIIRGLKSLCALADQD